MNLKPKLKFIKQHLEDGTHASAARECVVAIEQVLREILRQHLARLDEKDQLKVRKAELDIGKEEKGIDKFGLGELIGVFNTSGFLDAWVRVSRKDLTSFRAFNLYEIKNLRNDFIHGKREATRAEAELLLNFLKVALETFDITKVEKYDEDRSGRPFYVPLFLILLVLVGLGGSLVLINQPIPTWIQLDLTVDRVVFKVGGIDSKSILNSVDFQSLTIEKFASIQLSPEKLKVADPTQYLPGDGQTGNPYLESTWKPLTVHVPQVIITGEDETLQPAVTLESAKPGLATSGSLDRVWVRPDSEVTLEVRGTQTINLTIQIDYQESSAALLIPEPFQLITNYGLVSGLTELPYQSDSLTYWIQLPDHSPFVEVKGQSQSLVLIVTFLLDKTTHLFSKDDIPITSIDFIRQNSKGNPETTLVKEGQIAYPEYPDIERVSFKASDFIGLDQLDKFNIKEIMLDPQHKGIQLRLSGIAGHIQTGSSEFSKDHRLTRLGPLWYKLKGLFLRKTHR